MGRLANGTWLLTGFLCLACGGGDVAGPPAPIAVVISPAADTLTVGARATFRATVSGATDTLVTWTLVEGPSAGALNTSGEYTASPTPGTFHIVASSDARPQSRDTAVILVVAAPSATISSSDSILDSRPGQSASVPFLAGAHYSWSVTGGTLTAGQGTQSITFTSGSPGTIGITCTVRNLADSAVTGSRQVAVVAGPVISSFSALHDSVTVGTGTKLTALFAHGTGTISPGIGAVTSGSPVDVGPFSPAYVGTQYTLTVTGFRGVAQSQSLTIVPVNPPVLAVFKPIGPFAPVGGHGYLWYGWNLDPGVTGSIQPGIGAVQPRQYVAATPVLTAPGALHYTLTVTNPGDSSVSDTATVTGVAPASGALVSINPMINARWNHTATLLDNGRVLIAGGETAPGLGVHPSETYDPVTGQFSLSDSLTGDGYAAVRLHDGRVLVVGTNSTEIYNPQSNKFSAGPQLSDSGYGLVHAAVLGDGRVLAIHAQACEVLDLSNGTSTVVGSISEYPWGLGVVSLVDGRVLVAGGDPYVDVGTAEIFDPASNRFSKTGPMHSSHYLGTYTRLADGRVLAAGGGAMGPSTTRGELFDPATGNWTLTGALAMPRYDATATLRGDAKVVILGGINQVGDTTEYDEVYDPVTELFTPFGETNVAEPTGHVDVMLGDGTVLLTGGSRYVTIVGEVRILR